MTKKRFTKTKQTDRNFNRDSLNRGQVYLVVIFALTSTFIIFFILTSPLTEQVKNIVIISDSYQALALAESGLEISLFKIFKNRTLDYPAGVEVKPTPIVDRFESTGRGRLTQRTIFFEQ